MGISVNTKTSGFRKWAEIHEPTKIGETRTGENGGGVLVVADVRQDAKKPEQQPHLRGSFPGAGKV